jgi:hypothetical protein
MEKIVNKPKWTRIAFIAGIIALILGTLDPLEGSVVILFGGILLSLSAFVNKDHQWRIFIASTLMILAGVSSLFILSSLGGFGGNSSLSWWWGILILPYPLGWLIMIVTLIIIAVQKGKKKTI